MTPGECRAGIAAKRLETAEQCAATAWPSTRDERSIATAARQIPEWVVWSLVVGGTLVVFWPILPKLWQTWLEDGDNSHGVLVPLVSAALVWSRRHILRTVKARPSPWGFVLATIALAVYLGALRAHLALPARMALVLTVAGLLWGNFGGARVRVLGFPLVFLFFMIPVPDTLEGLVSFPLQRFASAAAALLLSQIGIPVLHEGTMLYFADASLEVAEACSGLRSLVSYGITGILLAYLGRGRLSGVQQVFLVAATIPVALAVNILRVAGTGVLATFLGSRAARSFLHEFSGFIMFAVGLVLLWGLSSALGRLGQSVPVGHARKVLSRPEKRR